MEKTWKEILQHLYTKPIFDAKYETYTPFFIPLNRTISEDIYLQKAIYYGGYLEKRTIYHTADRIQDYTQTNGELRSIHLGYDFWVKAGETVFAPLTGKIHSTSYNPKKGQYGGCLIVEHGFEECVFYTLYGHISEKSVVEAEIGKNVLAGEPIGIIGKETENGYWLPHLHFQIILDLQGFEGEYYGVAAESEVAFFEKNCPDPNYLLKLS